MRGQTRAKASRGERSQQRGLKTPRVSDRVLCALRIAQAVKKILSLFLWCLCLLFVFFACLCVIIIAFKRVEEYRIRSPAPPRETQLDPQTTSRGRRHSNSKTEQNLRRKKEHRAVNTQPSSSQAACPAYQTRFFQSSNRGREREKQQTRTRAPFYI